MPNTGFYGISCHVKGKKMFYDTIITFMPNESPASLIENLHH